MAGDPRLEGVYRELASAAGNDLFLRAPAQLGLPVGSPLSLQQVGERQAGLQQVGERQVGVQQIAIALCPCVCVAGPSAR